MKNLSLLLIIAVMMLAGCNSSKPAENENGAQAEPSSVTESDAERDEDSEVDTDSGMTELKVPGRFYEGMDPENVKSALVSSGVEEVTHNSDGSYTLMMTNDVQTLFLVSQLNRVKTFAKDTPEEGMHPAIKEITFNNDLTILEIIADEKSFDQNRDGEVIEEIAQAMAYYQVFDNVQDDKVQVEISLKDEASGNVFDTKIYK